GGLEFQGGEFFVIERERVNEPVLQLRGRSAARRGEEHGSVQSFAIEDLAAEIYASHGLYEDFETRRGGAGGQGDDVAFAAAIHHADRFAIEKHPGEIMGGLDRKDA